MMERDEINYNLGTQPLDEIMIGLSLDNGDLVKASREGLSFKQVQKARKGRRITANIKGKILRAIEAVTEKKFREEELFNYES